MRVLLIGESIDGPSTRYRMAPLLRALIHAGHEAELVDWEKARDSDWLESADVVVLQRRLLSFGARRRLRRRAKRLVFDFDDAILFRDGAGHRFRSMARRHKFEGLCRVADCVIAGNDYLRHLAEEASAKDVCVVPTTLDEEWFMEKDSSPSGAKTLVWIGGRATRRYLEALAPVWREVAPRGGDVRLRVIADRSPQLEGVEVEFVKWDPATERSMLASASIGVAPLPDDPFSRGKCGLKILQYGAVGIPTVASPVGVQRSMVGEDETGFLVPDPGRWVEILQRLLGDESLCARLGAEARRRVRQDYAWKRWQGTVLSALQVQSESRGKNLAP